MSHQALSCPFTCEGHDLLLLWHKRCSMPFLSRHSTLRTKGTPPAGRGLLLFLLAQGTLHH